MRFSFVIISVLFFALSSAKKWSPDKDEGLHKVHKGKHYVGDDEAHSVDGRKEEKEQYYKRKHFTQVDHKPLLKHSPIHITEEDAKLQLDLDKPERKHHRREPDLHIQHLNSAHKSNSKNFDENERKEITNSQLTNDKENKEHSEKNEKHHHHHHNHNKNHDKEVKPNHNKEKKYNPKIYVEQVNKFDGLKHRGIDSDDKKVERKKERKPKNKSQEKKEAKDKKKRKYIYNKKKEGGKKYKVIVYGKY